MAIRRLSGRPARGQLDSSPRIRRIGRTRSPRSDELGVIRIGTWRQYPAGFYARLPRPAAPQGGMNGRPA